jgi:hypothetical protein
MWCYSAPGTPQRPRSQDPKPEVASAAQDGNRDVAQAVRMLLLATMRTDIAPRVRFSATVEEEAEVEVRRGNEGSI